MKQILSLFMSVIILVACNSSGSNVPNEPLTDSLKKNALKDSASFTTLYWPDSTFTNVGDVKKGQTVEIPFVLENSGDNPLIISSVQPGCGCTVAEKPVRPIMPGKTEKIVAKFNSTGQSEGTHSKTIVVVANTKPFTRHILTFKANVIK